MGHHTGWTLALRLHMVMVQSLVLGHPAGCSATVDLPPGRD